MGVLGLDALLLFRAGDIPPARQLLWNVLSPFCLPVRKEVALAASC